jgi:hypothetical protein
MDLASGHLVLHTPLADRPLQAPIDTRLATHRGEVVLEWRPGSPRRESPRVSGCLTAFMGLIRAADEEILAFARQWGPLALCRHGQPFRHRLGPFEVRGAQFCMPWMVSDRTNGRAPSGEEDDVQNLWERGSLRRWRYYAEWFEAFLSIAANLSNGKSGTLDDWAVLNGGPVDPDWSIASLSLARQRDMTAFMLTRLLQDTGVQTVVRWQPDARAPRLVLLPYDPHDVYFERHEGHSWPVRSLFGVLACQLAAAVQMSLYRCERCDRVVPAKRKRRYCDDCAEERTLETKRASWHKHGKAWPSQQQRQKGAGT